MLSLSQGRGARPTGTGVSMEQVFSCEGCHASVREDEAFLRSVNLRAVAWCRTCWFSRHPELTVPAQRTASTPQQPRRRWLSRH